MGGGREACTALFFLREMKKKKEVERRLHNLAQSARNAWWVFFKNMPKEAMKDG